MLQPSLSYVAHDYELNQIALEYDGKEAPINHIKSKVDQAIKDSVKVFFFQKEFDSRQAESFNNQIGTKLVTINPMGYEWANEMNLIANGITGE